MRVVLLILSVAAVTVPGCVSERSEATTRPDSLLVKVEELTKEIRALNGRIIRLEVARSQYDEVTIDPSTKNFQRLDTSVGTLLVSCQDIRQYANGYKVLLNVGNVTMATLHGFKLNVSWGRAFTDTSVTDWQTARHENTFDVTDELLPGRWNKVSFVLSPAQAHDLDYVTLAVETNIVSLLR